MGVAFSVKGPIYPSEKFGNPTVGLVPISTMPSPSRKGVIGIQFWFRIHIETVWTRTF